MTHPLNMTHPHSTGSPHQSINVRSSIDISRSSSSSHIHEASSHLHEASSHIGYDYVEVYGTGTGTSPQNQGGILKRGLLFSEEGLAPVETPAATQHLSQALLHPPNYHQNNHHQQQRQYVTSSRGRTPYSPAASRQGLDLAPALQLPLPHLTDEQFEAYFKVTRASLNLTKHNQT